jgi:hypothetical protein
VVECGGLENRYGPFWSIEGSNPSPSAGSAKFGLAERDSLAALMLSTPALNRPEAAWAAGDWRLLAHQWRMRRDNAGFQGAPSPTPSRAIWDPLPL